MKNRTMTTKNIKKNKMIAELRKAPQHDIHSKQTENAGETTSRAYSSLLWRRLGRFIVTTVFVGFVLNELWEMAQMPAYTETAGHSWAGTLGF
jgi:hypothetical protein